jgi:hypothetical protein
MNLPVYVLQKEIIPRINMYSTQKQLKHHIQWHNLFYRLKEKE